MGNNMKYPNVKVQLTGQDGNAFFILGRVGQALKKAKVPKEEIEEFHKQAMSGNYDNLLRVCTEWCNCS